MHSHNPSGLLVRSAFHLALAALGLGLRVACRCSARFRSQLTAERTVQIGSADGVFYRYEFATRSVTARSGWTANAAVSLCFDNARLGVITLVSPQAVGRIVRALLDRLAEYEGNAVLVLWFFGLTRYVLPLARSKPLPAPLP